MGALIGNLVVAIFGFSGVGFVVFLVIAGIVIVCKSIGSK
jgi:hypothetical protein